MSEYLTNPINLVLLAAFGLLVYKAIAPAKPAQKPKASHPKVVEFKEFTPKELQKFNGKDDEKIYLCINRKVYDVSSKKEFYGPGSMYENFSGRDASRDLDMLTAVDAKIDPLADLKPEDLANMKEWETFFDNKYPVVGKLVENTI